MSDPRTARTQPPGDGSRALRLLGLAAAAAGVLLVAVAAFALSYAGIHAVALSAGVSPRLARLYPVIFDAMLVVACAAILSLRGAGRPSRCYAWLTMLVLLVAAAAADTLHATGGSLPHKPAAAAAAIIPWALVLIGFGLLLTMLRQARLRLAAGQDEEGLLEPSGPAEVTGGIDALLGPRPSSGPDEPPARNGFPAPAEPLVLSEPLAPSEPPAPAGFSTPNGSPEPESAPDPAAEPEPGPAPEAESLSEINGDARPETRAGADPEPEPAAPERAAGDQPGASPPAPALAATARLDRTGGSPVPPGA
jgi:Protein of unknown function (DUF2637)